ncbi:hypothetical protein [Verrucomicrobium spinosum]|uniref:hypothetical protein n=1 Tax=Verrucomicrobium spinosum TaxID=2736 RepID=UPI00094618A3|nr:hypothetical protein [Verrucomicrobium spinosum]
MPYADPEKQRQAQAAWFRNEYRANAKFRKKHLAEKAAWWAERATEEEKERRRVYARDYMRKKRASAKRLAAKEAKAKGKTVAAPVKKAPPNPW